MAELHFTLTTENEVARLTLDNPQRANALDRPTLRALAEAVTGLAGEAGLRALVLTGAGERAFCGGADLADLPQHKASSASAQEHVAEWEAVTGALARLPCLTVARINGACIGAGLSLALACDLRVAVEAAFFQVPTLKNGVVPLPGDVPRLLGLVGMGRAKALWLGGWRIGSGEALRWGLVERVTPPAELGAAVSAALAGALAYDPVVLRAGKRLIDGAYRDPAEVRRLWAAVYDRES